MDFTYSFTVRPSKQFAIKLYDITTPKTCGYTTLQNIIFFKNCVDEAR